jgi:hypothetical protein
MSPATRMSGTMRWPGCAHAGQALSCSSADSSATLTPTLPAATRLTWLRACCWTRRAPALTRLMPRQPWMTCTNVPRSAVLQSLVRWQLCRPAWALAPRRLRKRGATLSRTALAAGVCPGQGRWRIAHASSHGSSLASRRARPQPGVACVSPPAEAAACVAQPCGSRTRAAACCGARLLASDGLHLRPPRHRQQSEAPASNKLTRHTTRAHRALRRLLVASS